MTETPAAPIQDGHVAIRPAKAPDKGRIRTWRNKPHVRRNMYTDHKIKADEHEAWFEAVQADQTRELWVIQCDGKDIGVVLISEIDPAEKSASWAFYIGEEGLTGRGIGTRVERLVLHRVFDEMKYDLLRCEVLEFNYAVIGLHRKFGFRETGKIEAKVERDGKKIASICLELKRRNLPKLPPLETTD